MTLAVHVLIFAGLTTAILLVRRALEWLLLREPKPMVGSAAAPPEPGARTAA